MTKHLHHLRFRRGKYYARVHVPQDLRQHFEGAASIEAPMKTDSPSQAALARDLWLAGKKAEFDRLRAQPLLPLRRMTEADLEAFRSERINSRFTDLLARAWRTETEVTADKIENTLGSKAESREDLKAMLTAKGIIADDESALTLGVVLAQAEEAAINLKNSGQQPRAFKASIPLDTHVDAWLSAPGARKRRPKAEKTKNEFRFAVNLLGTWLDSQKVPRAIEAVTHVVARSFVSHLKGTERSPVTSNKLITGLSSYWEYLKKDQHVTENPWRGKWLAVSDTDKVERRGFTDTEAVKVFKTADSEDDAEMINICAMGLLTAARREELFTLKVSHIDGDVLVVPGTKTEAAARYLPIHPLLAPVLARLAKGKGKNDYLLDAPEQKDKARARGDAWGKRFGRFKTRLFGETDELVFHSWRHTLANLFERAGVPEAIAARIVGHATRMGITYGTYSREDLPVMRDALLQVKLPKPVERMLKSI